MSNPFDFLLNQNERESSSWKWATVTSISPLRIRLDQEPTPLPVTPINLAGELESGDRVWVQMHRSRDMDGAQPIIMGSGSWFVAPPLAWRRLINDGGQSVPESTNVRLGGWYSAPDDPGNGANDLEYTNSSIYARRAMVVHVDMGILYNPTGPSGTGGRELQLWFNGNVMYADYRQGSNDALHIGATLRMEAGDRIDFYLRQGAGGTHSVHTSTPFNYWSVHEVR